MVSFAECAECKALLQGLRTAFYSVGLSQKDAGRLRADCLGTVAGADELLSRAAFRPFDPAARNAPESQHPQIAEAFERLMEHQKRSGHTVLPFR